MKINPIYQPFFDTEKRTVNHMNTTLKKAIAIPQTPEDRFDALMLALNEMQPELTSLLNRCGVDNAMETPDYLLSEFVMDILINYDKIRRLRASCFNPTEAGQDSTG